MAILDARRIRFEDEAAPVRVDERMRARLSRRATPAAPHYRARERRRDGRPENGCKGRPRQPWRYARARTPVNGIICGKCPAITSVRSPITSAASAFSIQTASHQGAAGS
jgi:hypothetical protein